MVEHRELRKLQAVGQLALNSIAGKLLDDPHFVEELKHTGLGELWGPKWAAARLGRP